MKRTNRDIRYITLKHPSSNRKELELERKNKEYEENIDKLEKKIKYLLD